MKRVKKKKIKVGRIFVALLVLGLIGFGGYKAFNLFREKLILNEYYVASDVSKVKLYTYDAENDKMVEADKTIFRGNVVKSYDKTKTFGEDNYLELVNDEENNKKKKKDKDEVVYYINKENITDNKEDVIKEKTKFVRTSVTVYKNETDSKISSFIKKGNELEVVGYDKYDEEGIVNMYKIKKGETEGWVYGKYLVDNEEDAKANYNEDGVYDKHKDRKYYFELYGGKASTLDYYPFERVEFKDNPILKEAKAMYLNGGANVIGQVDSYISIAKESGVNAMVVDIKDGALSYPVEIAKDYSMTAYNSAINSFETYKSAIDKIKAAGIYVIGRIVVFNDTHYGKDHPEDCISSNVSSQTWPSAYSRGAWEYNVELAKAAVHDMGFNEIQFDYVRFPESAYNMSKSRNTNFRNSYDEEKAEAIQNFLFYALDQLHKEEVYLSVDVFGECSSEYVTSYGQYWPAISNIVDAISSMPYTDHFGNERDTWSNPYPTVNNWAKGAAARQTEIPTPAIARTWITAYDTPWWNPTVVYNATKISDQVQALYDAGLNGGFITWHAGSNLNKYNQIKSAFSKEYKKSA